MFTVQHRAHHRDGEETFQITVTVPIHDRHGISRFDAQLARPLAKRWDAFAHLPIGLAFEIAVNDFLIGKLAQGLASRF